MRRLSDTNMMNYIQCEQIDPYNLTGNEFGYNKKEKTQICRFLYAYQFMPLHPDTPTFEINGHEASE